MRKHLWAVCFSALLFAFTVYIALDTFVLSASYNTNAVEMNTSMFEETPSGRSAADSLNDGSSSPEEAENSRSRQNENSGEPASDDRSGAGRPGGASGEPPAADRGSGAGADRPAEDPGAPSGRAPGERPGSDSRNSRGSGEEPGEPAGPGSGSAPGGDSAGRSSGSSSRSGRSGRSDRSDGEPGGSGRNSWNSAESAAGVDAAAEYSGDTTYKDSNVAITLTEYTQNDTKIYVADVTVSSTQYIKTAFAKDTYGKNVTESTSAMAVSHNAIFAVNGDYYGAQERGFVIRNGIVYRDTAADKDVLCIYADGTLGIVSDREYTADELVANGVWQAFSFGPALVEDGAIAVSRDDEVGRGMVSNPRTAVGMINTNHFVFVVSDGRTDESEGLSLYELAQFMLSLGVKTAYNLDGGGSSTMFFNGQVVNNPTSGGGIKERGVSDIVYIG